MPPTEDCGQYASEDTSIPEGIASIHRLVNTVTTMLANGIIHNANTQLLDPIDPYSNMPMPYLPNLRDLLRRTTGSDDLGSVTEVKLKVITREVGLQHLSVYTPNLRELTLDGSVVSSLRDLGCRLYSLKVLKVNRCKLRTLDGLNGLRNIEKLYAANNKLTDLTPCTCLELVRHIDVAGSNLIDDMNVVAFLVLCPNLKDLVLDENFGLFDRQTYREDVKRLIPQLKTLDGIEFTDNCSSLSNTASSLSWPSSPSNTSDDSSRLPAIGNSNSEAATSSNNACYTVSFSPKLLSPRNENNENVPNGNRTDVQASSGRLPKI